MFHSERMPLIFLILSLLFQEVKLLESYYVGRITTPEDVHVLSPESVNMLLSVQAAITKLQRLGGLNNKHLLLMVLKNGSPTSGWQDGWVLAKALFQVTDCQLVIHMVEGGLESSVGVSSLKALTQL